MFNRREMTETLRILYKNTTGQEPTSVTALTPAGSNRRYYRLQTNGGESLVGVVGTSADENRAFVTIARHFLTKGIPVPEVKACSTDMLCYLQQDLGDTSLFALIQSAGDFSCDGTKASVHNLLRKVMMQLPDIQFKGADGLDFGVCYPLPSMDRRSIMWDLNYFKYCFLKGTGIDFSEPALEDDFERLAEVLLREPNETLMYRDFQSRNVMIYDGEPYYIDFQGARRGPVHYDVASFLWQARAHFSDEQKENLIAAYLDALQSWRKTDADEFRNTLHYFVLFRQLQVLGAYGFRGRMEGKAHFLQSIPYAIEALKHELQMFDFAAVPYLQQLLRSMTDSLPPQPASQPEGLTVQICSFSYKRGIPADKSDNGGGFVFDCRAISNPGRYEQYKTFTGKDDCVKAFLDGKTDMAVFLQHVFSLVDQAVERYLARGFSHLMVSFGCTGGQHRSVYAAEYLAEHLKGKYDVHIDLTHKEQQ